MAVLAIVDLIKNYGHVPAVRGVSLTVDNGELLWRYTKVSNRLISRTQSPLDRLTLEVAPPPA